MGQSLPLLDPSSRLLSLSLPVVLLSLFRSNYGHTSPDCGPNWRLWIYFNKHIQEPFSIQQYISPTLTATDSVRVWDDFASGVTGFRGLTMISVLWQGVCKFRRGYGLISCKMTASCKPMNQIKVLLLFETVFSFKSLRRNRFNTLLCLSECRRRGGKLWS